MGSECGFNGGQIVVWKRQREPSNLLRHASRTGNPKCRYARTGLHQQPIGMAVVAALEFDDDLATGSGSRKAYRGHRGLSAGADKAQLLDGRKTSDHALGEIRLGCRGSAKAGRVASRSLNGLDHRRKGMAQNHRPPGAEVVDVAVAVRVDKIRALSPLRQMAAPRPPRQRPAPAS